MPSVTPTLVALLSAVAPALAVNGGASGNAPFTYSSFPGLSVMGGSSGSGLKGATYQYTGMGSAESTVDIGANGDLIYSPALTPAGNGFAVSSDNGETWRQIIAHANQTREQPIFRRRDADNRYFFWTSNGPGFDFSYSDDSGSTWTNLNGSHFDSLVEDWGKLVGGKPVRSQLSNGAKEILYLSAPSLISTPLPVQPLGPIMQVILKSTDRGNTWTQTAGTPTLIPALSGGSCSGLVNNLATQELIIWGDGFVRPNGTIMYGLRRCQALSVAISDDEGDTWRFSDVPGSHLTPFIAGDITYLFDGNVLVPNPISQDLNGNIYAIWVDNNYVLQMASSSTNAQKWSNPIVIGAPGPGNNTMAYLPHMIQHPTQQGRAALAYYGSTNGGIQYNAYLAETTNINSANPTWTSVIANPLSQAMQKNTDQAWDQGYGDPLYDLVEFTGIQYYPGSTNIVAAFARSMCASFSTFPQAYNTSSCVDGWNYTAHADSRWQGFLAFGNH